MLHGWTTHDPSSAFGSTGLVKTCRILTRCVFIRRKTGAQLAGSPVDSCSRALMPPVDTELYITTWISMFSGMETEKRRKERCSEDYISHEFKSLINMLMLNS